MGTRRFRRNANRGVFGSAACELAMANASWSVACGCRASVPSQHLPSQHPEPACQAKRASILSQVPSQLGASLPSQRAESTCRQINVPSQRTKPAYQTSQRAQPAPACHGSHSILSQGAKPACRVNVPTNQRARPAWVPSQRSEPACVKPAALQASAKPA